MSVIIGVSEWDAIKHKQFFFSLQHSNRVGLQNVERKYSWIRRFVLWGRMDWYGRLRRVTKEPVGRRVQRMLVLWTLQNLSFRRQFIRRSDCWCRLYWWRCGKRIVKVYSKVSDRILKWENFYNYFSLNNKKTSYRVLLVEKADDVTQGATKGMFLIFYLLFIIKILIFIQTLMIFVVWNRCGTVSYTHLTLPTICSV